MLKKTAAKGECRLDTFLQKLNAHSAKLSHQLEQLFVLSTQHFEGNCKLQR